MLGVDVVNVTIAVNDQKPANGVTSFVIDDVKALFADIQIFVIFIAQQRRSVSVNRSLSLSDGDPMDRDRDKNQYPSPSPQLPSC
ncbi:hypothetical protein QYF36_001015 [Acer negundo]|nr:hypothetical protein QYF36_001015 [Acer negundo]